MAKPSLTEALNNVEMIYQDITQISNDMLYEMFNPINNLINEINNDVNNLTVDQIRDYMVRLQLKAYEISEVKDKSAFKAEVAQILEKEKLARAFNAAEGSAAAKEKQAILDASEEVVTEALYNLMADLLKTKLDQLHRLVDCLKSILMSKMQEAKLSMNGIE